MLACVAAAALALALGLWFALGSADFCLDDAWIHLAYALSLKRGEGLSYNPGDLETGSSSPLWALLLAGLPWGGDPVLAAKLLGVALHATSAGLCAALVLELARHDAPGPGRLPTQAAAFAAGALAAAHPALLQGATSGMEVSLTSALLLAVALCVLRERAALAGGLALLATLARPESLFFVGAFGAAHAIGTRRVRALAAPLGALCGLLAWMAYCLVVSGYAFPNTKYVKGIGLGRDGLTYLALRVLPAEPWLVGLGGAALVFVALRRAAPAPRYALAALLFAWLATLLAVALSRPFALGVLFYFARYFAIVAAIPLVAVGLGLVRLPAAFAALLLAPVLLVNWQLAASAHARQRAQEQDIGALHTEPARYLARHLPARAVVVVEGAGAARFLTPRSMTIIDMIGLNDSALAHARDDRERLCAVLARRPTHLLIPDQFLPITVLLQVEPLRSFDDPAYHVGVVPAPRRVVLFALRGLAPRFRDYCAAAAR